MNHEQFDAMLRRRVAEEAFEVEPRLEGALKNAILHPAFPQKAKRAARRGVVLAVALSLMVCAAALALTELTARPDVTAPAAQPLAQPGDGTQQAAAIRREDAAKYIHVDIKEQDGVAVCSVSGVNPFDEPLLVRWTVDDGDAERMMIPPTPSPTGDRLPTPIPTGDALPAYYGTHEITSLLAPGMTLEDSFTTWLLEGGDLPGVKVTLGLMREEPYRMPTLAAPDDEDYDQEQAAMEEALQAGRVVLVNGCAPALPDARQDEEGGRFPLSYYVTRGYFDLWEIDIAAGDAVQQGT